MQHLLGIIYSEEAYPLSKNQITPVVVPEKTTNHHRRQNQNKVLGGKLEIGGLI
jgi:hypothetical protein